MSPEDFPLRFRRETSFNCKITHIFSKICRTILYHFQMHLCQLFSIFFNDEQEHLHFQYPYIYTVYYKHIYSHNILYFISHHTHTYCIVHIIYYIIIYLYSTHTTHNHTHYNHHCWKVAIVMKKQLAKA